MRKMGTQFQVLGRTQLWNFLKKTIEEEYGVDVVLLRVEIGINGEREVVKKIALESCTIPEEEED